MDKVVNELKKMNGKERERKKENRKIEIDWTKKKMKNQSKQKK
jgi:hypothetical protein